MQETLNERLAQVRKMMLEKTVDGLLVFMEENRRYLSGFTGEDHQFDETAGALLITAEHQFLITDSRFELQAALEAPEFEADIYRKSLFETITARAAKQGVRQLGFESIRVSFQYYEKLQSAIAGADAAIALVPLEGLVERLREVKGQVEIEKTRHALAMAEDAFRHVARHLKVGMTEKQIAWDMEKCMREAGADGLSFPVIVAAGPNSALPHAIPTDRPIKAGEPILFDWGAKWNGYCSDTSRTVIIGKPDDTFLNVHQTVLEAQKRATEAIKAGANGKGVDAIAREFINQSGYEGRFGHGLGHGTGLATHEAPRLSPTKENILSSGMLVTVEPGIYLPEWGGVRIENQVVVDDQGPIVLNALPTTYDITLL